MYSLRDLKKCFDLTEVDFRQKLKTSILESEKFEFLNFFKFEGLFAGTFERVKVAKKIKHAKFSKKLVKQSQKVFTQQ